MDDYSKVEKWAASIQRPEGSPELEAIRAAARVLYDEGQHHDWWDCSANSFDDLDPIGKLEFEGIVERVLLAAHTASLKT